MWKGTFQLQFPTVAYLFIAKNLYSIYFIWNNSPWTPHWDETQFKFMLLLCTETNFFVSPLTWFQLWGCIHITFHCWPVLLWCCFIGKFCILKSKTIPCFASNQGEANIEKEIQPRQQTYSLFQVPLCSTIKIYVSYRVNMSIN